MKTDKAGYIHKLSTFADDFVKAALLIIATVFLLTACSENERSFSRMLQSAAQVPDKERQALVDNWMSQHVEFPLLEDSVAIFVYRNQQDVPVYVSGDMTHWRPKGLPMYRIIATDYFYATDTLPIDARIEYKFVVDGKYQLDSLNKKTALGGFGSNSLLMMPQYRYPETWLVRKGRTYTRLDSTEFSSKIKDAGKRAVYVYRHNRAQSDSPLIFFHDGGEYLTLAHAAVVLDNLISAGTIAPCNAVFVNPVKRMEEYWMNDGYMKMVFNELLPWLYESYTLDKDAPLFMGGASLGGLISFYALKNFDDRLSGVFSQSGSFWVDSLRILRELKESDLRVPLFYSYGSFERQDSVHSVLTAFLKNKNATFEYAVYNEGHTWGNWGGHLDEALTFLLNEQENHGTR